MSYIQPSTRVRLLRGIHNTSDNKHTLYFASLADQKNFYESASGITFTDFSFQRGTQGIDRIRVGASYGSLYNCSYMLFNNEAFLDKNFYAFITDIRYVNNECCDIYYKIDDLQTWLFDINLLPSFMDRCTSDTDAGVDLFTDESLSPGEMQPDFSTMTELENYPLVTISDTDYPVQAVQARYCVMISATMDLAKANVTSTSGFPYPGEQASNYNLNMIFYRDGVILDSVGLFCVPLIENPEDITGVDSKTDYFKKVYNFIYGNGFTDYIIDMWIYPMIFINYRVYHDTSGHSQNPVCMYVTGVRSDTNIIEMDLARKPSTINGYTPKNNKLFSYPFLQMIVSNNNGSAVDYRYEWFSTDDRILRLLGTTTAEAKVRGVPLNYGEGSVSNKYDSSYAIDTAPYPSVSYSNDAYAVWLAQNRNTIENNFDINKRNYISQQVMSGFNATLGLLTGGLGASGSALSAVENSLMQTQNAMNNIDSIVASAEDMRQRPPTASGVQSVGLAQQNKKIGFTSYAVVPTYDRVVEIDNYFTMYGYSQKRIMPIQLKRRSEFTYIKTVDCNIQSSIPKDIERKIVDIFNNGIWFWVNNANMCNFEVTNGILT